jgi:D-glycero-alpha-D-manno-heptose-7-phosphate kinase
MIVTRTPFRISFFGGGTDYPPWFREHGGAVLATSINKYCYITIRHLPPFFEHKHRIVYSRIETVSNVADIKHPSVRAVLGLEDQSRGFEVHHDGDLPARSGLGTSSSFTVGLVNAVSALKERYISKEQLASRAIHIEQDIIKETVGSQDQVSAAFGGLNRIEFNKDGTFQVDPVVLSGKRLEELQDHLMLFYTRVQRTASDIAKAQIDNIKNRQKELKYMHEMVDRGIAILQDAKTPISKFGELLDESWRYKRSLSDRISTPQIDEIYEAALKEGAIGGKILGAGGGGFLLLFAPPERHADISYSLNDLVEVPFRFERAGSRVVFYQPNGLGEI